MERRQLNSAALSCRQLCVAMVVAGLSPGAALAGTAQWNWLVLWMGVSIVIGWLVLHRLNGRALFTGKMGGMLCVLYSIWGILLASRVLEQAATRLERASGGGVRNWLLLLLGVVLIWICCGKPAAFFRLVEILWLAIVVVLAVVLVFGLIRMDWQHTVPATDAWLASALAAGEIITPALFVLPYIYKVESGKENRGLTWLALLGCGAVLISLITMGLLGGARERLTQPFFVAGGLLGRSSRCEELLAVLWLLPDLTLAGLFCRVSGGERLPALAGSLAVLLSLLGIGAKISTGICALGSLILLLLIVMLPPKKEKIVVEN